VKKQPTVRDVIKLWLVTKGCDGLAGYDCGCGLDDLMTCDSDPSNCVAGKCRPVTEEERGETEYDYIVDPVYFEEEEDHPSTAAQLLSKSDGGGK
jgi:hypothetical protein